ncbi:MAG: DUF4268 domain-containing protein [Leptolyngbyaceae cyanobacterium SM2_5_2]|nr:DUF4268 domain-containing protein [Leptolyngbyaceae cyanobacterium SM2_5_2]
MRPKRTDKPKLGRLEQLHPEDYWPNAAEFQHWLAEADNLELLSEAVGMTLSPHEPVFAETEEVDYGLFEVPDREDLVLVMAQPGPSEAAHLGDLITWAAQEQVSTVVWVAAEFAEDHIQTLTWLNQLGAGMVQFLGMDVELWRIGKNAMAVNFKPVHPITEEASEDAVAEAESPIAEPVVPEPEPLTALQQENLDFWSGLSDLMDRQGSLVKPGAPTPAATMGFAIARAGFRLNAILDREHGSLYTELLLSGVDAHPHFYLLAHERELIADDIGLPLIWDDSSEHTCVIASTLAEVDLADRDCWPNYQVWFCDCLERFYEAFFERIKQLDAAGYHPLPHRNTEPLTNALVLPSSQRG